MTWLLILPCTRAEAEAMTDDVPALSLLDPLPVITAIEPDETQADAWEIHAYFEDKPDAEVIDLVQSLIPSAVNQKPRIEHLPSEDWITMSQRGLAPVEAGRFYVHTSTNKGDVPGGATVFQIEASLAFGTGGHDTTQGCLVILDQLKRQGKRFNHIADIGTGTGLLAFAAMHLWPRAYATASDIDPVSIDVTANNAATNGITLGQKMEQLALCVASGTDHEMIQRRAPYDLLVANILAGPLIELAPSFAEIITDGGTLVLAGLLDTQKSRVSAAYRAQGFRLVAHHQNTNSQWPALCLTKRPRYSWRRATRATGRTTQAQGDFGTW
jgi:ribosomal protein L11 methyltransferase